MTKAPKATPVSRGAPAEKADGKGVSEQPASDGAGQPAAQSGDLGLSDIAKFLPGAEALGKNGGAATHEEVDAGEEDPEKVEGDEPAADAGDTPEDDPAKGEGDEPPPEGEEGADPTKGKAEEPTAEEEEEEEVPPKDASPQWFQKRIDKITAKRKEAEGRAETAEALVQKKDETIQKLQGDLETISANSTRAQPTAFDPLADAMTEADVQRKVEVARTMKVWAMKNPDGGTFKLGDKEYELDADAAKEHLVNADAIITELAPARKQFLKVLDACNTDAKRIYPSLFDKSHADYHALQNTLARIPGIRSVPQYAIIVGDALEGQRIRKEREAAAGKPKPAVAAKKAPPKTPERTPLRKSPANEVTRSSTMKSVVSSGGSKEALTKGVGNLFLNA